jgi:nucleoside-diphosphate-sugar epimerase
MRILMIGGTGLISSSVVKAAVAHGYDVTLVTRGTAGTIPAPAGVSTIHADAENPDSLRSALRGTRLRGEKFDSVIQFIAFEPEHVAADVETFARLTDQYVLISTGATYRLQDSYEPRTESTPQDNVVWRYAQQKALCEQVLAERAEAMGLGWTIVRPAHTYGDSRIPAYVGNSPKSWTIVDRLRRGADIIVPGDGTSLWTITHADDLAVALVGLLGNTAALSRAFHIVSDVALTWERIYREVADASGISPEQYAQQVVHVPSDAMTRAFPELAVQILGDKMHPAIYDTSAIKEVVPGFECRIPFAEGVRRAVAWFEAHPDRQAVDDSANERLDKLGRIYRDALEASSHI